MPHSPQQIEDSQRRLDRFAELISLDIPIPEIRERLGIGKGHAHRLMARLRQMYGEA